MLHLLCEFAIPKGVELLHGRYNHFVDSSVIDLAFRSDRETFDGLRPTAMQPRTIEDYRSFDIYKQKWWRNPSPATEIWIEEQKYATTIMTWDSDGLVQFHWSALD